MISEVFPELRVFGLAGQFVSLSLTHCTVRATHWHCRKMGGRLLKGPGVLAEHRKGLSPIQGRGSGGRCSNVLIEKWDCLKGRCGKGGGVAAYITHPDTCHVTSLAAFQSHK